MAISVGQPELRNEPPSARLPEQAQTGAAPVREVSILDILLVLSRHRRFIVTVTVVFTFVAMGISLLVGKTYTGTTVILPPQSSGSTASSMMSELGSLGALGSLASGSLGIKNPGDMYVALFKSESVEDGVIQEFGLQKEYKTKLLSMTRAALENRVTIAADTKTSLITIKVQDGSPQRAAAIANGYVDQYRHLSEHLAISEAAQRRLFFQQQLVEAKNNLGKAEDALIKTEQTTGLLSIDSQSRALIDSAASLRAQITAKQVQIQGMETYAAADNAGLVQAEKELDGLKAELARMGGNSDPDSGDFLVPKGRVPEATIEYARKLRDVKYYETIFNLLARQFELAKLDEAREGALVQVVDPALVPDRKSGPKRSLWTIVGLLVGFVLSTLWVLWKAALRFLHEDPETDRKLRELRGPKKMRRGERVQRA